MSNCALFVDHENIFFGLLNEFGDIDLVPTPDEMAKKFKESAARYGTVCHSEAIADWEQSSLRGHVKAYIMSGFDIDYNITGKNNADLKISNEIRNLLEKDSDGSIHTFILATGDGGYQPIIETLLQKGKKVIIWGVKNCTSSLLQAYANEYETVERLFDLKVPEGDEPRSYSPSSSTYHSGMGGGGSSSYTYRPTSPDAFNITTLEALVISFDELLGMLHVTEVDYSQLMDHLSASRICGSTVQEREFWFTRAVEDRIIVQSGTEVDEQGRPKVTLNTENLMVAKILNIKTKLFKMLKDTLHHDFCPDFKRARDTLVNMIPGLHKSEAHTWLNWFIQKNLIVTERRPHQQKPGAFFTVLRLNPEHPYVSAALEEAPVEAKILLLIVLLDDFLTEKTVPWIAASTLLKILKANYLRDGFQGEDAWLEAKNLLNEALKLELILKRNERDPMTGFETSQIFLNQENEKVIVTLETKLTIIKTLHEALRDRPLIAKSTFTRQLSEVLEREEDRNIIDLWIATLEEQGLVLEKPLPGQEEVPEPLMSLTLNYASAVVIKKVKQIEGVVDDEPEPSPFVYTNGNGNYAPTAEAGDPAAPAAEGTDEGSSEANTETTEAPATTNSEPAE